MPPTYLKPATVEALVATIASVAAAAPELPYLYYHIPSMTGVDFKMYDFVRAADGVVKTLRGVKFTDNALDDLQFCVNYELKSDAAHYKGRSMNMLYGHDQQALSAFVLGVHGAVGSTYNWNGELQNKVLDAANRGDLAAARAAQLASARFVDMGVAFGAKIQPGADAWKTVMQAIPGVPSMGPPRLPFLPATPDSMAKLAAEIKAWCAQTSANLRPSWCATVV